LLGFGKTNSVNKAVFNLSVIVGDFKRIIAVYNPSAVGWQKHFCGAKNHLAITCAGKANLTQLSFAAIAPLIAAVHRHHGSGATWLSLLTLAICWAHAALVLAEALAFWR